MSRADDGLVEIEHGAVENGNARAGGFLPVLWINGRLSGNTWSAVGHDRDAAERVAALDARREAARYVGDWTIRVRARAS